MCGSKISDPNCPITPFLGSLGHLFCFHTYNVNVLWLSLHFQYFIDSHTKMEASFTYFLYILGPTLGTLFPREMFGGHNDNMPIQYAAIFHGWKNYYFWMKKCDIFLNFAQNIDRGYTLEPPQ